MEPIRRWIFPFFDVNKMSSLSECVGLRVWTPFLIAL